MTISRDRRHLVVAYQEHWEIWDTASLRKLAILDPSQDDVATLAFCKTGTKLFSRSYNMLRIWDWRSILEDCGEKP